MANRTVKDASSIHGTNPQYLVEKIIRTRVYDSKYWKEECFALTAELLVDKAMALRYIGGVYGGNIKPSPFLCLTLKMLQIQPEKDIIIEFIKQDEFKYVRALGCFYLRLVYPSLDCYKYLGPLLNDYRKLRIMDRNGIFQLSHMDEYIDNLLREERYNDVILPRIQKRWVHETNNELEPRVSLLEDDLDDLESESDEEMEADPPQAPASPPHRRGRHGSPPRDKRRRSVSPAADEHKRRRDRPATDRPDRAERRHRDSGRGERERDHYGNNHYGGGDYHNGPQHATDYNHRSRGTTDHYHGGRDNYHHSSHHGRPAEDYGHTRAGGNYYGGGGDEYRGGGGEDRRRRDDRRVREEPTSGRRGGEDTGSSRRKEGKEKDSSRRKEGRSSRKEGGNSSSLQAEIDEANALRAQLGLPPLK